MKVSYEDHMGDDLKVVNMARVSFGSDKRSKALSVFYADIPTSDLTTFVPILETKDKGLIQFLARGCSSKDWEKYVREVGADFWDYCNDCENPNYEEELKEVEDLLNHIRRMPPHWTPFGHCQMTLHMKVPIFVARQLDKHQVGFVKSEVSRRYRTEGIEFFEPEVWRKKADNVKQGSSDESVDIMFNNQPIHEETQAHAYNCLEYYEALLASGVCPEQARMVLPQSMYTEYYLTGSLYGWANMYIQRSDPHAQKEVREVARQIGQIAETLFPESWKALTQ